MDTFQFHSSNMRLAPVTGSNQYPTDAIDREEFQPGFGTAVAVTRNSNANAQSSNGSLSSIESDRWSQRGISSRVSISVDDNVHQSEENDDENKQCLWLYKVWGNCILPGIFGIDDFRIAEKMFHKHPISKQILTNVFTYNNVIRNYIRNGLLTDIKPLATQMYFPTGQIEADGLSVISAEIWAATYLLLCIHRRMREADFHNIRSAYSSLAWDSGQVYRETLRCQQIFHEFCEQLAPSWREIEKLAGVPENVDFIPTETENSARGMSRKYSSKGRKNCSGIQIPPPSLPTIRISDDLVMQNSLALRIIPEMKSALVPSDSTEKDFNELEYGRQIEIIKELLAKPAEIILHGCAVLKLVELNLLNDGATSSSSPEDNITCTRAMKILTETLKLLYKEVKLTPSLRFDVCENIRATSEDIHSFLAYTDWVISKISEFHSMLRLCYNYALLCFDLDLPSFEKVLTQEQMSEDVFKFSPQSGISADRLEDKQLEYKVASLTKLMMEASTSLSSMHKQGGIDDNFEWEDFYKTDYHMVLQRLPLRLGFNLLQFSPQLDTKLAIQQHLGTASPNFSADETLTEVPRKLRSIYRKEQRQETECRDRSACWKEQPVLALA